MPPGAESESDEFSDSSSESSSSEDVSSTEEEQQQMKTTKESKNVTLSSMKNQELKNQPFDEAMDLSDEDSTASMTGGSPKKDDARSKTTNTSTTAKKQKELEIKNQPYDHALELSDSFSSPVKEDQQRPQAASQSKVDTISSTDVEKGSDAKAEKDVSIKNKPFDEEMDLSEDSDSSVDTEKDPGSPAHVKEKEAYVKRMTNEVIEPMSRPPMTINSNSGKSNNAPSEKKEEDESESEDSESEDSEEHDTDNPDDDNPRHHHHSKEASVPIEGGYDEKQYTQLQVSQEIKELFQYIGRFKAQEVELETTLKCFIPEYIPAVGEMDAFLKVKRPLGLGSQQQQESKKEEAGGEDPIGLRVLDEPALLQSDATVLDLQLRAQSRKTRAREDLVVRSIEDAEKNPKEIQRWISSIADLHRNKPPPSVHYDKSMPDIDELMEAWAPEMEQLLSELSFPPVDTLHVSLEELVRIMCAILDIPVYKNMAESLHVMFTLFLEFRDNQHFAQFH